MDLIDPWSSVNRVLGQELKSNALISIDTVSNYPEVIRIATTKDISTCGPTIRKFLAYMISTPNAIHIRSRIWFQHEIGIYTNWPQSKIHKPMRYVKDYIKQRLALYAHLYIHEHLHLRIPMMQPQLSMQCSALPPIWQEQQYLEH